MVDKEILYNTQNDYVEVGYDIDCMVSMLEVYEEHYIKGEYNEFQDTIHIIKVVAESVQKRLNNLNTQFDEIVLSAK